MGGLWLEMEKGSGRRSRGLEEVQFDGEWLELEEERGFSGRGWGPDGMGTHRWGAGGSRGRSPLANKLPA